jgi:Holliday junction resolvase RusA-like endonuclease
MTARAARTTEAIEIRVPGSPSPELAPNRRAHGFAKAAATRQHRHDAQMAAYEAFPRTELDWPRFEGPVAVSVLIRWGKGHRRHDLDSCAVSTKPYLDGLTDAGIWGDDRQIARLTIEQERDESGRGEVVIRVEEMP